MEVMMAWRVVAVRCSCGNKIGDVIDTADGFAFEHARPIRKTIVEDGRGFVRGFRPRHKYPEQREPLDAVWQVQCVDHDWLYIPHGFLRSKVEANAAKIIVDHRVAAGRHRDEIFRRLERAEEALYDEANEAGADDLAPDH